MIHTIVHDVHRRLFDRDRAFCNRIATATVWTYGGVDVWTILRGKDQRQAIVLPIDPSLLAFPTPFVHTSTRSYVHTEEAMYATSSQNALGSAKATTADSFDHGNRRGHIFKINKDKQDDDHDSNVDRLFHDLRPFFDASSLVSHRRFQGPQRRNPSAELEDAGRPRQPRAEGHHRHRVARLDAALVEGFAERQRHRRR